MELPAGDPAGRWALCFAHAFVPARLVLLTVPLRDEDTEARGVYPRGTACLWGPGVCDLAHRAALVPSVGRGLLGRAGLCAGCQRAHALSGSPAPPLPSLRSAVVSGPTERERRRPVCLGRVLALFLSGGVTWGICLRVLIWKKRVTIVSPLGGLLYT